MATIVSISAFAQDAPKPAAAAKAVTTNGQATLKPVPVAKPIHSVAPQPVATPATRTVAAPQSVKAAKATEASAPKTK